MRNRLLSLLFVSGLFGGNLSAQAWDFGVQGGATLSIISGTGAQGLNKFGGTGGINVGYRYNNPFSFRAELSYIMKGTARNPNTEAGDFNSFRIDLDYVEIPVFARWHLDKSDKFTVDFGLTFGVLVRDEVYENGGRLTLDRGFNPFELGGIAGVNYHVNERFCFQLRLRHSILPIRPNVSGQTIVEPDFGYINIGALNAGLNIGLAYRLI
jgi:hypothetical protein